MKTKLSLVTVLAIALIAEASVAGDFSSATRCSWGFSRTAALTKEFIRDSFSPVETSSWGLCKLALNRDFGDDGADWVDAALEILPIPANQLKPVEFLTKRGQCEIGSILFQKKYTTAQDSTTILLTARGVCSTLPASLSTE